MRRVNPRLAKVGGDAPMTAGETPALHCGAGNECCTLRMLQLSVGVRFA